MPWLALDVYYVWACVRPDRHRNNPFSHMQKHKCKQFSSICCYVFAPDGMISAALATLLQHLPDQPAVCQHVLWSCVCLCVYVQFRACVTCIWVSCATEHEGFEVHTHTDTHSQAVGRSAEEGLKAWQREKSVRRRGKHQWWCNLRSRGKSKKKGNASFWSDAVYRCDLRDLEMSQLLPCKWTFTDITMAAIV